MARYFVELAYKGTNYHGWQIQQNAHSVQEEVNKALSTILQEEIMVTGAGRTDTGVHAEQFFIHFDAHANFDLKNLTYKLNCILPSDISCYNSFEAKNDWHARFSATTRTYEYRISTVKNPFLTELTYFFPHELNVEKMNRGASFLIKETDFSCFSKSKTDTFTNICNVTEAFWETKNNSLVFTITANRFLRNMVRAIVGTLLDVGQEKIKPEEINTIIQSKQRSDAGKSVAAEGLFLTKIEYPFLKEVKG